MSNPQSALKTLSIRDIETLGDMRQVEAIQKEVWGLDDREVFPTVALIPIIEAGGVLIGAYAGDRLAGFVFGYPGQHHGRPIMHSDMLAVRPAYRSLGLGYRLKLAQRERALANGIDTITWTFDPLQSLNAHFNIARLGAIADSYRVNYYGDTSGFLHRAGTDRLWATWQLLSTRVKGRIEGGADTEVPALYQPPAALQLGPDDEPVADEPDCFEHQSLAIEIPEDINWMLTERSHLAERWRRATRMTFTRAISSGFFVKEFYRVIRGHGRVGLYLLARNGGSAS